jgi:thiamine pyrophosphokinase
MTHQRYPQGLKINGQPGELVSLIAHPMIVKGIITIGLKYPLCQEDLHHSETRGISNEMISASAEIQIREGELLVIHSRNSENKKEKENR